MNNIECLDRGPDKIHSNVSNDIEFNNLSELSTTFLKDAHLMNHKDSNNSDTDFSNASKSNDMIKQRKEHKKKIRHRLINRPILSVVSNSFKNIVVNDREKQLESVHTVKHDKIKSSFVAIFVGMLTAIGGFLYGYDTGLVNGLMEMSYFKTHFSSNHITFTSSERAILTAILSLGTFAGSLGAPFVSDRYGRRCSMIWTLLIILNVGIILQICSEDYGVLLAGRFLNGFGVGVISSVIPLYQAEVSPSWIRGSIISMYQWAITWGLLVSSAISQGTRNMNNAKSFRIPIGLQFVWAAVLLFGFWCLPESPRYYVMKNDLDGAIISLSRFRRLTIDDEELIEELIEIKASYDYEISDGKATYSDCFKSSNGRSKQLTRMFTCILLQACQQCSGINFIFYYGVNFFVGTGVSESYLMSLITYIVNAVFSIPGVLLVDKVGRRKLLITGALGMIVSNYLIAIVGLNTNSIVSNKVMLAFVCVFIAFFASSWGPVVWVVTGELFSLSIRQKAVSLAAGTNWVVNFIFAYSTPYIIDEGSHTGTLGTKIFFLWGSLNVLALVVTVFFVYETKGLMLEEVNELYRRCSYAYRSPQVNEEILKMGFHIDEDVMQGKESENEHDESHGNVVDDISVDQYRPNDVDSNNSNLTPMDYLRQWEERQERNNVLADNIIARQSDHYPSILDTSDGMTSGNSNEGDEDTSSGESGSSEGRSNMDIDLDFNYALYGDSHMATDTNTHFNSTNNNNEVQNDEHDNNDEDDAMYQETLRQVIEDLSLQSGFDLHPRGSGSPN